MSQYIKRMFCWFIGIWVFCSVNIAFARTRAEVINEANLYKDYPWSPSADNIWDDQDQLNNPTVNPAPAGQDGIDDRGV